MLSEHQIRGWIAVSAEGLQGEGSPKRISFFTDAGMKARRPARRASREPGLDRAGLGGDPRPGPSGAGPARKGVARARAGGFDDGRSVNQSIYLDRSIYGSIHIFIWNLFIMHVYTVIYIYIYMYIYIYISTHDMCYISLSLYIYIHI